MAGPKPAGAGATAKPNPGRTARGAPSAGASPVAAMPAGLEAVALPPDAIEVGRILGPWGVKGWFKVQPFSADPQALFSSKRWYLLPAEPHAGRAVKALFQGCLLLPIREAKDHADGVVASSAEVADRSQAESLQGARVLVPRTSFPTTGADEFYWVDLIGLQVVNREGVALGVVKDLMSTGPQSVLVLQAGEGDGDGNNAARPPERLIPFVAAYVDQVDLPGRRIVVDWQPDY